MPKDAATTAEPAAEYGCFNCNQFRTTNLEELMKHADACPTTERPDQGDAR